MADVFTGWFLGAEVGADWGHAKPSISGATSIDPTGFAGGGSLGYRSQVANGWYLGLSTSLDLAGGSQVKAINNYTSLTAKNDWFGATMVQVGYRVLPDLLVYGEGGVGYGAKKAKLLICNTTLNDTEDGVGWAVGAGADYNLRHITGYPILATVEYRHIDLGQTSFAFPAGSSGFTAGAKAKITDDAILVGAKYKFGR
jgi:outer membrane immunogenic protein